MEQFVWSFHSVTQNFENWFYLVFERALYCTPFNVLTRKSETLIEEEKFDNSGLTYINDNSISQSPKQIKLNSNHHLMAANIM